MKRKKRILIFDDQLFGHHLEYIHHIHEMACENKDIEFIFALPFEFNEVKKELKWKESVNVKYHFISNEEANITGNFLMKSYKKSNFIRKIVLNYSIDEVFFMSLMGFLPMISFFLPQKVKISGIIYLIYLYRWKDSTLIDKLQDSLKYLLLSQRKNFKTVYILNDKSSAIYLNKKFNTTKFTYLIDPYKPISEDRIINIRKEFSIPDENIVYSHFGGLTGRKGTLKILDSIELLDNKNLINTTFIFAGKIKNDIKNDFYEKYDRLKNKVQILCFDEFCEYSFLGSICLISNSILLPYDNTAQSSGLIGYGAQFKVPVVVPDKGLLGKLVKKYHLGQTLDISNAAKIADFIRTQENFTFDHKIGSFYIEEHSVSNFTETIFSKLR